MRNAFRIWRSRFIRVRWGGRFALPGIRESAVLALKALVHGPSLDQRPIHRAVIGLKQLPGAGLPQHLLEDAIGHFALQQPLSVLQRTSSFVVTRRVMGDSFVEAPLRWSFHVRADSCS
jgi:hypothetical protein